jgi:pimeloyl-ACP methyl ester carboxylesterase
MKTSALRYLVCLLLLAGIAWFALARSARPPRPQTPRAPLPYGVEQVAFDNASVRLAGTLTLPRTPGPHPAIVLRSDKRGLGQSGGVFASATSLDFASDIQAGLAFLRSRPDIDAAHIGLPGHSEGGLIGSMVAVKNPSLAFLVLMAGNGIPAGEMFLSRTRRQMAQDAPGRIEQELALQKAVFAAVTAPGGDAERKAAVRSLYLAARSRYGRPYSEDEVAPFLSPWMRTLLKIDPQPVLRQLHCPVLALAGDKDAVVTADENIPALERALADNPRAQVRRLPGLNHFFQRAQTGELSEVADIEETIAPRALALIGSWAARHSAR